MLRRNFIFTSIIMLTASWFSKKKKIVASTEPSLLSDELRSLLVNAQFAWPNLLSDQILVADEASLPSYKKCMLADDYFFHNGILVTKRDVVLLVSKIKQETNFEI